MSIASFIKRDAPDLAQTPIVDLPDVRTLSERYATAEVSFETVARALQACRAAQSIDDSATTHREHDVLEAERQRLLEPGLETDVQRARVELIEARRALTSVKAAAHAACVAARLPGRKRLVAELFDRLDGAVAASRALVEYGIETARLLDRPYEAHEPHAAADWFVDDAHQESGLALKRRLARAEGLL